jgi:uncharacterized protein
LEKFAIQKALDTNWSKASRQKGNKIIAIEVKSGENVRSKSFSEFYKKYSLEAIRFSALPFQKQDWMENRALYAVGSLFRD